MMRLASGGTWYLARAVPCKGHLPAFGVHALDDSLPHLRRARRGRISGQAEHKDDGADECNVGDEAPSGIEPLSRGAADPSLSHLGTAPRSRWRILSQAG